MNSLPILLNGKKTGEAEQREEGLYLTFHAVCQAPGQGVFRLVAVGTEGELPLGIPAPSGGKLVLWKKISRREAQRAGELERAELRACGAPEKAWTAAPAPEQVFHSPFLRERVLGAEGALISREEKGFRLAIPCGPAGPFPLAAFFCFAQVTVIGEREYAVFRFDREENPLFP